MDGWADLEEALVPISQVISLIGNVEIILIPMKESFNLI